MHGEAADEAEFLADHGEDEVGLFFRQEVEMALGALQEALAPHASRTQGDFRLDDVVAGAERIALGMEEGVDAGALIVVQVGVGELGEQRDRQRRRGGTSTIARRRRKRSAAPSMAVMAAVPRLGSLRIRPTGMRIASIGGIRNSGLPMRSQDARWNHDASARTRASFISSDGWSCSPPSSIQRWAPLPTWPMRRTRTSSTMPRARAAKRVLR